MTVAFDAYTTLTQADDPSGSHNPVGTPRGALVLIVGNNHGSDSISSVTYDGDALTEISLSPLDGSATAESLGFVYGYFKGDSLSAADPATVTITTVSTAEANGDVYTVTAGADTEMVDTDSVVEAYQANPSGTLSLGGATSFCAEVWMSGRNTVAQVTELSNWTARRESDHGPRTSGGYSYDTIGSTDVTHGYTAPDDDVLLLATALTESAAGPSTRPSGLTLLGVGS